MDAAVAQANAERRQIALQARRAEAEKAIQGQKWIDIFFKATELPMMMASSQEERFQVVHQRQRFVDMVRSGEFGGKDPQAAIDRLEQILADMPWAVDSPMGKMQQLFLACIRRGPEPA